MNVLAEIRINRFQFIYSPSFTSIIHSLPSISEKYIKVRNICIIKVTPKISPTNILRNDKGSINLEKGLKSLSTKDMYINDAILANLKNKAKIVETKLTLICL